MDTVRKSWRYLQQMYTGKRRRPSRDIESDWVDLSPKTAQVLGHPEYQSLSATNPKYELEGKSEPATASRSLEARLEKFVSHKPDLATTFDVTDPVDVAADLHWALDNFLSTKMYIGMDLDARQELSNKVQRLNTILMAANIPAEQVNIITDQYHFSDSKTNNWGSEPIVEPQSSSFMRKISEGDDDPFRLTRVPLRPVSTVQNLSTGHVPGAFPQTLTQPSYEELHNPAILVIESPVASSADDLQDVRSFKQNLDEDRAYQSSDTSASTGTNLGFLDDLFDKVPIATDVRNMTNWFQPADVNIESLNTRMYDHDQIDSQVHAKREYDLGTAIERFDLIESNPRCWPETLDGPELVPQSVGQFIGCWLLDTFSHSWLQFARLLFWSGVGVLSGTDYFPDQSLLPDRTNVPDQNLFLDKTPFLDQMLFTFGYIHIGSLVCANWFSDGSLELFYQIQSSGRPSLHPSISSATGDVPLNIAQYYRPGSEQSKRGVSRYQLYRRNSWVTETGETLRPPDIARAANHSARSDHTSIRSPSPNQVFTPPVRKQSKDTTSTNDSVGSNC